VKKVLVGLDNSSRAADVLVTAAHLAHSLGGELVLYRAVGLPREVPPEAYALGPDGVADLLQSQAKKEVEVLVKGLTGPYAGVPMKIRVEASGPWRGIIAAATEENVDLIVIGSHGYSGLDRVMGTTAAKVVDHAACSVLVVRQKL